jgi:hypothetical protein
LQVSGESKNSVFPKILDYIENLQYDQRMIKSKKYRVIVIGLALAVLVLVCGGWWARVQEAKATQRTQDWQNVRKMINRLKVGPEAIVMGSNMDVERGKLGKFALQQAGVEWFFPYSNQVRHGIVSSMTGSEMPAIAQEISSDTAQRRRDGFIISPYYRGSSTANFWLNDAVRICKRIESDLKKSGSLTRVIEEDPSVWSNEIRPRLLILSTSVNPLIAIKACRALLASGEESEYLTNRLTYFAHNTTSGWGGQDARDTLMQMQNPITITPCPTVHELPELSPSRSVMTWTRQQQSSAKATRFLGKDQEWVYLAKSAKPYPVCRIRLADGKKEELDGWSSPYRINAVIGTGFMLSVERRETDKKDRQGYPLKETYTVFRELPSRKEKWAIRDPRSSGELLMARIHDEYLTSIQNRTITIRYLETGQIVWRIPSQCTQLHVSERDTMGLPVMVGLRKGRLIGWFGEEKLQERSYNPLVANFALSVSKDRKRAVTIASGAAIVSLPVLHHWDLAKVGTPQPASVASLAVSYTDGSRIQRICLSPDEKYFVAGHEKFPAATIWKSDGTPLVRLGGLTTGLIEMGTTEQSVWTLDRDGKLNIYDWAELKKTLDK